MAVSESWVRAVLDQENTSKYNIEFDGHRHNHLAQGFIALYHLGASQARMEKYMDINKVMVPGPMAYDTEICNDIVSLKGQKRSFYSILDHYCKLMEKCGSIEGLIKKEFPKVSKGLGGAALHGLIQLGYGYSVRCERVICEGLAWLYRSYVPLDYTNNDIDLFGCGTEEVLNVFAEIENDKELMALISEKFEKNPDPSDPYQKESRFERTYKEICRIAGVKVMYYVNRMKGPVLTDEGVPEKVSKLMDWIVNLAITVYVKSHKVNCFFLLHGVTGSWSLREIIKVLSPGDAIYAIRYLMCAIIVTYIAQLRPSLSAGIDEDLAVNQQVWDEVIDKALSVQLDPTVAVHNDVHVMKVVKVCYDMWRGGKYPTMAATYLTAANIVIENPYVFQVLFAAPKPKK